MRFLIAIALSCGLALGIHQAASSGATVRAAQPPAELTTPSAEQAAPDEEPAPSDETSYECKYSPYCQRASQCTAYCAGGAAVCFQGCCACAS
ncbi:MAG TPA: hypothetical protein VNO30_40085 [Kofleriaceae bacterium]|nr:hypothetical protein [Kofleriaceae bacterium]